MTQIARKWLDSQVEHADLYELVGLQRFHPQRTDVLKAIRAATRELVQWQGHSDSRIAGRAVQLLRELGRAESIFSSDDRIAEYHHQLVESLRAAARSRGLAGASAADMRTWLVAQQRVHPAAVGDVQTRLQTTTTRPSVFSREGSARLQGSADSSPDTNEVKRDDTQQVAKPSRSTSSGRRPAGRGSARAKAVRRKQEKPVEPVLLEPVEPPSSIPRWIWLTGGVIVVILLVDLAWMLGMFSGAESERPAERTSEQIAGAELTAPDSASSTQTGTPDTPPQLPKPPPSQSAPGAAGIGIDDEINWSGILASALGVSNPTRELHLLITSDGAGAPVPQFEVIVEDANVIQGLSDYISSEEQRLDYGRTIDGDQVQVSGVVVSGSGSGQRLDPTAPLIRPSSIQRIDEPESLVEAGGARRPSQSFRDEEPNRNLRTLIRITPDVGSNVRVRGVFQNHDSEYETVFVAPAGGPRGVEVHFPNRSFDVWASGDTVEATGVFHGQLIARSASEGLIQRPIIIGASLTKPGNNSSEPASEPASGPRNREQPDRFRGPALLVATEEGAAAVLRDGTWHSVRLEGRTPDKLQWCLVDRNQHGWICGEGGLTRLDGNSVQSYTRADGIPDQLLNHLFEDSAGRVWISAEESAVAVYSSEELQIYDTSDGLRPGFVNACVEDGFGRVWAVGNGVSVFQNGTFEGDELGPQFVLPPVMAAEIDRDGRVYFGFIGGLLRIDGLQIEQVSVEDGLPQRTPQAVFVDSQERIWAGTWGGGAVRLARDDLTVQSKDALPGNVHVARFCEDDEGAVWSATMEGLWRFDDDGWERVRTPDDFTRVRVVATIPDTVADQLVAWTNGTQLDVDRPRTASPRSNADQSDDGPLELIGVVSPLTNRNFRIRRGVGRSIIRNSLGAPQVEGEIRFGEQQLMIDVFLCPSRDGTKTIVLVGYDGSEDVDYIAAERGIPASDEVLQSNVVVELVEDYEAAISGQSAAKKPD